MKNSDIPFGTQIRNRRKELGLSQEQLASKLFVDRSLVSRWESGKITPNPQQIQQLSELLSLSIQDISASEIPSEQTAENSIVSERKTTQILVVLMLSIISYYLNPFGLILALISVVYSFIRKLPVYVQCFAVFFCLVCLDEILFMNGIYWIKPVIHVLKQ
ncbi:MAG: helix-turn-helix transcriptional regulator [Solobacterium sp.]|nr:helix-turn-helix transcriptional regulator [Solobacterium sp.]